MLSQHEITATLLKNRLPLVGFFAIMTRSFHTAEDVFQDVLVKVLSNRELEFESSARLLSWARIVGNHRAIDLVRARDGHFRGLSPEILLQLTDAWPNPKFEATGTDAEDFRSMLADCLSTLTQKSREIVRLRYYEERRGVDVAKQLDMDIHSLYQSLARIHRRLRDCVERKMRFAKEDL